LDEMVIMAPNGFLGYGFPQDSFQRGLNQEPHLIGADSGSSDPGPYYLGKGKSLATRVQLKRDFRLMLAGARQLGVPALVGSAATAGAEPHLAFFLDILYEVAREEGLHFRLGVVHAEIDKELVKTALAEGRLRSLPGLDLAPPSPEEVDSTVRIVGQMGIGPYIRALEQGAEVIVAGRSCDTSIFAALPIARGFDPGLSYHMAKILECGALCATPGAANDCLLGRIRRDHFLVKPLTPARRCTEISVAAHSLYEQSHPFRLYEPEGMVDLSEVQLRQVDERTVRVEGSRFVEYDGSPTIKLEGVRKAGYRTISIAGIRDPLLIQHLADVEQGLRDQLRRDLPDEILEGGYEVYFRYYGRDGVLGRNEPCRDQTPHEVGLVIEAIAPSQEKADAVCALTRSACLHFGFPDRKTTAGNLAFPFSPSDFRGGPLFEFSVYHLLEVEDPAALFEIELISV